MKRIFLLLVFLAAALEAGAVQKDTVRVLAIGNSFSQDAVEQNLHDIAKADGKELIIGNMYIGGCSLKRHFENIANSSRDYQYRKIGCDGIRTNTKGVTLEEALADEPWDVVTLQQSSPDSGFWDTYEPYLGGLVSFVKEHSRSDVNLYFHQTWAYETNSMHKAFPRYECNQKLMYGRIMSAVGTACEKYNLRVIPCGTAIQNVRGTWEKGNCTRDGYHLNNTIGRYTAALTWYAALSGHSVVGNAYHPEGLNEFRTSVAQNAADAAVARPYAVTNIGFKAKPAQYSEDIAYTLPDPLVCTDGTKVKNKKMWMQRRRPELLEMFETQMYGKAPAAPSGMRFKLLGEDKTALEGLATRKEVKIVFDKKRSVTLLMYVPNAVKKAPVFLGINFYGNQTIASDSAITAPDDATLKKYGIHNYFGRGEKASPWPLEYLLGHGYAVATFTRDDIDPDFDDGFLNGVHPLAGGGKEKFHAPDQWGSIAAWAWGLSRAMDYLVTDSDIDASRVAVFGHSRLGKAALWAGASDERFALVISNCSGCAGAALSRRRVGETIEAVNRRFPHWFCGNFQKYNGREDEMPFDQHELLALVAPRALYVASAEEDRWADPHGEQLAAQEASKVWKLFGSKAAGKVGCHLRAGKHALTLEDWQHYVAFADKWLSRAN